MAKSRKFRIGFRGSPARAGIYICIYVCIHVYKQPRGGGSEDLRPLSMSGANRVLSVISDSDPPRAAGATTVPRHNNYPIIPFRLYRGIYQPMLQPLPSPISLVPSTASTSFFPANVFPPSRSLPPARCVLSYCYTRGLYRYAPR